MCLLLLSKLLKSKLLRTKNHVFLITCSIIAERNTWYIVGSQMCDDSLFIFVVLVCHTSCQLCSEVLYFSLLKWQQSLSAKGLLYLLSCTYIRPLTHPPFVSSPTHTHPSNMSHLHKFPDFHSRLGFSVMFLCHPVLFVAVIILKIICKFFSGSDWVLIIPHFISAVKFLEHSWYADNCELNE